MNFVKFFKALKNTGAFPRGLHVFPAEGNRCPVLTTGTPPPARLAIISGRPQDVEQAYTDQGGISAPWASTATMFAEVMVSTHTVLSDFLDRAAHEYVMRVSREQLLAAVTATNTSEVTLTVTLPKDGKNGGIFLADPVDAVFIEGVPLAAGAVENLLYLGGVNKKTNKPKTGRKAKAVLLEEEDDEEEL